MGRQLATRSVARGVLFGSMTGVLLLLLPDPSVARLLAVAVAVGALVAAGTYRTGTGRAALPDSVLILLFGGMTLFWIWVLVTGHRGMVVEGWPDAAAAGVVIGIPICGITLVLWNRRSPGRSDSETGDGAGHESA